MPSVTEKQLCKVSTRFPLESRLYMCTEQFPFSGVHEYSTIPIGRDNHTYKVTIDLRLFFGVDKRYGDV